MTTQTRSSGIRVLLPNSVGLVSEATSVRASGRRGTKSLRDRIPIEVAGVSEDLIAADVIKTMQKQDMQLVDTVPLEALPVATARGMRRAPTASASIDIDLAPNEDAVVLIERNDGTLEWCWPRKQGGETPQPALGKRRRATAAAAPTPAAPGVRTVRFEVRFNASRKPSTQRVVSRNAFTKWLADKVVDAAKAYVLKYVVRAGTNVAMSLLERNVERGLVIMDTDDPTKWRHAESVEELSLPTDRAARILLFIHGTFSNTVGSFGALGLAPWGQEFLGAARGAYDAVIGFDHPTLSVDPLVNASDLLPRLKLETFAQPPHIDVVCYSRGGLVFRVLAEQILPRIAMPPKIGRVAFVACTLGGTVLARPENWSTFVDFYTNLAAAANRVVRTLPNVTAKTAAGLVDGAMQGVAAFVKCLATVAVTENQVPGLAAMNPDGTFVAKLNENQQGQPTPSTTWYAAILSNFEPNGIFDNGLTGIPKGFAVQALDAAVDQLLAVPNDLVVHTDSMTAIDPQLGAFMKDQLDFGQNPNVYHTNYFIQPETATALARWFGLVPAVHDLPTRVDTDVLSLSVTMPTRTVVDLVKRRQPSFVVLERAWRHKGKSQQLHYAFPAEEILQKGLGVVKDISIGDFLEVHEGSSSRRRTKGQVLSRRDDIPDSTQPASDGTPCSLNKVVLDGVDVIGVIPGSSGGSGTDLGDLARSIRRGTGGGAELQILINRKMPMLPPAQDIRFRESSVRVKRTRPKLRSTQGISFGAASFSSETGVFGGTDVFVETGNGNIVERTFGGADVVLPRRKQKSRGKKVAKSKRSGGRSRKTTRETNRREPSVDTDRITCHFLAEMEERVELKKTASVTVTVSREAIQAALGKSAGGTASVQTNRKITIELLPKKNAVASGETRVDIDPPGLGENCPYVFDFLPTDIGEGEVQIRIRQGAVPILTLRLSFDIVTKRSGAVGRRIAEATAISAPEWNAAPVQLRITEHHEGRDMHYRFELFSEKLGLRVLGESDKFRGDRLAYVTALYDRIEKRVADTKSDMQAFAREMRAEGGRLLDELIPKPIQQQLWALRKKLTCIQVLSEEPFIPWEFVCLKDPDVTPSVVTNRSPHLAELGLVRWLDLEGNHPNGWPTTDLRVRKGRAYHVIPDYPLAGLSLPEAAEEAAFLIKHFNSQPIKAENNAVAIMLEGPGSLDLFHFAGHGDANSANIGDAGILLEGRIQGREYLPDVFNASVVAQTAMLQDSKNYRPIIVLNACRAGRLGIQLTRVGGFAKSFICQGAGLFVGAQWSVGDAPARTFTEAFYTALLGNKTVAEATREARAAALGAGEMTWLAYAVYGHPDAKLRRESDIKHPRKKK